MSYAVENALFQWEEGERRLRAAPGEERADLERAAAAVLDELRRRLGSEFSVGELSELYADGADWAGDLARRAVPGTESASVVDAAFARYARQASDYGGGRPRPRFDRI